MWISIRNAIRIQSWNKRYFLLSPPFGNSGSIKLEEISELRLIAEMQNGAFYSYFWVFINSHALYVSCN